MNKIKKCKHCGTVENLVTFKSKSPKSNEILDRVWNCCINCNEKIKNENLQNWKESQKQQKKDSIKKCKHCGTTEDLVFTKVFNQFMEEPIYVTKNICNTCFSNKCSEANLGKIVSKETGKKISDSKKNLSEEFKKAAGKRLNDSLKDPEVNRKRLEKLKVHSNTPEAKERFSKIVKEKWKDPIYREQRILSIKENWKDPEYKERMRVIAVEQWGDPVFKEKSIIRNTERLKAYWKDPEYRKRMSKMFKDNWTEERRLQASIDMKKRLQVTGLRFNNGIPKSSIPEQKLYDMIKSLYPEAKDKQTIETLVSRRFPDIVLEDKKLIVEYDGAYWHDLKDDYIRDDELKKVGYSVLHYRDYVPSLDKVTEDMINMLSLRKRIAIYKEAI